MEREVEPFKVLPPTLRMSYSSRLLTHPASDFRTRPHAPGPATALLLNLPITLLLLYTAIQAGYIQLASFLWIGPRVPACLLGAIPLLFVLSSLALESLKKASSHAHSRERALETVLHHSQRDRV